MQSTVKDVDIVKTPGVVPCLCLNACKYHNEVQGSGRDRDDPEQDGAPLLELLLPLVDEGLIVGVDAHDPLAKAGSTALPTPTARAA